MVRFTWHGSSADHPTRAATRVRIPSMGRVTVRTIGRTPAMAFVLDYLRQFPGADYHRVKAAAQAAGVGVPAPVIYGNALRVLGTEAARAAAPATPRVRRR